MLDWLKAILGEAHTAEMETKIEAEIGKHFISRADFNETNEEKKRLDEAVKERDAQIAELKKVDPSGLQAKISELEKANKEADEARARELSEAKTAHETEVAKLRRQTETKDFLIGYKFVNDETRDHYVSKLEAALDDEANKGKSRKEILEAMTTGEDGKPKENIFTNPESKNTVSFPPTDGDPGEDMDEFEKRISKYKKE